MKQIEININYKKLLPIVGNLFENPPLHFSLCEDSEYYHLFANVSQCEFQKSLDDVVLQNGAEWFISDYLENREMLLKNYPQMQKEKRFYHLGIDIAAPCNTQLYTPHDCEIVESKYEDGEGNYGGVSVLKCQKPLVGIFYMLFGHLNPEKLIKVGTKLKKGDKFAQLGNMKQNGNWFYHTHLQVLTPKAYSEGWISKGYCRADDIATIREYCPNPFLFL